MKTIDKLIFFFEITALIVSLYIFTTSNDAYYIVAILPIFYVIFTYIYVFFIKKYEIVNTGIIYYFAMIIIYLRYVITPLSMFFLNDTISDGALNKLNFATLLMVIELFFIYLVYFIYFKVNNNSLQSSIKPIRSNFIILIFIAIAILLLIFCDFSLLMPQQFFSTNEEYTSMEYQMDDSGGLEVLAQCLIPCCYIILFSFFLKQYNKRKNPIYILLCILASITLMIFVTSTKRWELLFAMIISIYFLIKSFKKMPRILIIGIALLGIVSIISISLYKFSWAVRDSENPIIEITQEMFLQMSLYFSGPTVVAESLEMSELYEENITLETFFNDFLGSIPIVSSHINQYDRINTYFNIYKNVYNNALIMPLIGIGYSYVPIFPMIFTIIAQLLVMVFNKKEKESSTLEYKYIYIYIGLYMAMCLGFNTQILFSKLLIPFSLLWLLFKYNEKICIRKDK